MRDPLLDDVLEAALEAVREEAVLLRAELREAPPLEAAPARPEDEEALLEAPPFLAAVLPAAFFAGTLSPSSLASDSPIAIACFLDVTFLPLRPMVN